jgi:hypothetical protein
MDMEVYPMKWKRTLFLALLLLAAFGAGAIAASQIEKVEAFVRHDYKVVFNGTPAEVGSVLIHDGSSYLPLAKIAQLLGVDVNFDNKTIYLNERFPGQPDPVGESEVEYDSVTLSYTAGYQAKYLGKESPVFAIVGKDDGKTYYRDIDLQRLGVDTRVLRKAKDTITKDIYVRQDELSLVTNGKPEFFQQFEKLVIGEIDQDRMKSIQNFIDGLIERFKETDKKTYTPVPRVIMIERSGENEYRVLVMVSNDYHRYTLKLSQNIMQQWYHTEVKAEYLGSPNPNYNSNWYYNPDYPFPW